MKVHLRTVSEVLLVSACLGACSGSTTSPDGDKAVAPVGATSASRRLVDLHEFGSPAANRRICAPAGPGEASCFARVRTDEAGNVVPNNNPAGAGGHGPQDLQSAYKIPSGIVANATIAIVDAYDYPSAASDLAVYRSNWGLPALCSTCFTRVGETGTSSFPSSTDPGGWNTEAALDLDMASAACPSCNLLLVEANSVSGSDLYTAVDTAAKLGATVISLSWGGTSDDEPDLNHPGVAIFASSGDSGSWSVPQFPAASPLVTAVGGTSLNSASNSRGWTEAAWGGGGSGCSPDAKPSWQADHLCTGRTAVDVSAVADPNTGVAVFISTAGGWVQIGGTSVASPLVAGIFAATGQAIGATTPKLSYADTTYFFDVTSGTNGTCGALCNTGPGYDSPTGNGAPNAADMIVPTITSISPNQGPSSGGTVIQIRGARFVPGATSFTVGGYGATAVTCSSTTACQATVPPSSNPQLNETVDVQAWVGGKGSYTGSQDLFGYVGSGPICPTSYWTCTGTYGTETDAYFSCNPPPNFWHFVLERQQPSGAYEPASDASITEDPVTGAWTVSELGYTPPPGTNVWYEVCLNYTNGSTNITNCGPPAELTATACTCTPTTCAASETQCGSVSDGCGGTLECGGCKIGVCSAGRCVTGSGGGGGCKPGTCS